MALIANLHDYRFQDPIDDLRGATVHDSNDEVLGKIKDVIFDPATGDLTYIVVDSSDWLSGHQMLVPARQVMNTVEGADHYRVNLTREEAQALPRYDAKYLQDDASWQKYEGEYREAREWSDGPLLHREGTTHAITPTPEEMPAAASASASGRGSDLTPKRLAHDRPRFGATSPSESTEPGANLAAPDERSQTPEITAQRDERRDKAYESGQAGIEDSGRRFREFQERLRRERERILQARQDREAA